MNKRTRAYETIRYRDVELASVPICVSSKRVVKLMEEDYIELHFTLENATYFPVGAYCDDELFGKFYITEEQMPKYNTSTGGYDYELKMEAWYRVWKQKLFMLTAVDIERNEEYRKEAEWYLTKPIKEQMREFCVNLQLCGYIGKKYNFRGDDEDLSKFIYIHTANIPSYSQSLTMTYSKNNLLDSLGDIAETWNCEWWVVGNEENFVIHFGKCEVDDVKTLELGVNVESMEANNDTSDSGTKLFCYGAEDNLPNTYRKELRLKMGQCWNRRFNAYYGSEKLDFGGTKNKDGSITDGLLPYGTWVNIRIKGGTGLSKAYDVKAEAGQDVDTLIYTRFKEDKPDVDLPIRYVRDYRFSIQCKFGDEIVQVIDQASEGRYEELKGSAAPDWIRFICEMSVCIYDNGTWKVEGYYPYALSHEEWYALSKNHSHLELQGHGDYSSTYDFNLWTLHSTALTMAMPEKNSNGNYSGKKSEYLVCTAGASNADDMLIYLDEYNWRLTVPALDTNFGLLQEFDIYPEVLTWWEGEESNTYAPNKDFNDMGGEDFDEYKVRIYSDRAMPLWLWAEYSKETKMLVYNESTQSFTYDGITLKLTTDGTALESDRLMWADNPHQFSEGAITDVANLWLFKATYIIQTEQSRFTYISYVYEDDVHDIVEEYRQIYELTLEATENDGLLANRKARNTVDDSGRADIIRLNCCADADNAQYETIHISCKEQKPLVKVGVRYVPEAVKAMVKLTYTMGVSNTLDAIDADSISDNGQYYVRLVGSEPIYKNIDMQSAQAGVLTYTTVEFSVPASDKDANATFVKTARVVPMLIFNAQVAYYDANGKLIDSLHDDIDKTVSSKIEVLPETDDNPTFQIKVEGTAFILRAKIAKFDGGSPYRDFWMEEYDTDTSFIQDGLEFVLESPEDYRVPYRYYTNAIDDPSSLLGIASKRLQLPRYNAEEYAQYKDKYNLSLIYDSNGREWITRNGWAYRNGAIVPIAYIENPNSSDLQELCITTDNIYPMAKFLVASVRTTDEQQKEEVEGESKSDAVTWYWKQYHITLMQANGDAVKFSQKYIRENSQELQLRFLVPEDVKEYADNGTLAADYSELLKNCRLAGMTFGDEFNDKIGDYEQDHAIARNDDFGAMLPNDTLYPALHDPVTLMNWNVRAMASMGLIASAEYSLLDYAFEYIDALKEGNFTFDCTMMSDPNEDYNIIGQRVLVKNAGLQKDKETRVIAYELKLDIPYDSPSITCGETEAYSRLKMLEKGVKELKSPVIQNTYYSRTGLTAADFGDGYVMNIETGGDTLIGRGETKVLVCTVYDALNRDVTYQVKAWQVARDSGNEAADAVWNKDHDRFAGTLDITLDDLQDANKVKFTFTATMKDEETAQAILYA